MTRKDYELIARRFAHRVELVRSDFYSEEERGHILPQLDALAHELARELYLDNPRFDEARFIKACGLEEA